MSDIRILIVEDDPFIAMDIESAVADRLCDAELIVVESVEDARRAASSTTLTCALLDIDVVGGKTFEVAERLLASGTPFVFVSGSSPAEVPRPLRDVRFLRKPFSTSEIVSFVSRVVGPTAA